MTTKELCEHLNECCKHIQGEMNFMLHYAEVGKLVSVDDCISSILCITNILSDWVEEYRKTVKTER